MNLKSVGEYFQAMRKVTARIENDQMRRRRSSSRWSKNPIRGSSSSSSRGRPSKNFKLVRLRGVSGGGFGLVLLLLEGGDLLLDVVLQIVRRAFEFGEPLPQ